MTPKQRVESILRGEKPDKIPFTIYEKKLPQCTIERELRNSGICIVRKRSVVKTHALNVSSESRTYWEKGIQYTRHTTKTPMGELFTISRPAGFTTWRISRIFKGPEDYKKLMFLVKNQIFEPDYESFLKDEKMLGEDFIQRAVVGANPLHEIMVSWMGIETFAVEWAERRDEIEKLYYAMAENLRKIFPIAARSPALHANFGGNETGNVMGRERFAKYVIPLLNEVADVFHRYGKFAGTHLDGNNKIWADLIRDCRLDYIEAFTPEPDTDMSLYEAFSIWQNKTVWINFPSSVHLATIPEIEKTAEKLINDSLPDNRLIIGITEDIPENRWQENLLAISRVIDRYPVQENQSSCYQSETKQTD